MKMENFLERIKNLTQKQKLIIGIITCIVIIIALVFVYRFYNDGEDGVIGIENSDDVVNQSEENIEISGKTSKIGILDSKKSVTVHIVGEVNSPGVVTLNEGARIIDAINAADGSTDEADLSKVNLAYVIEDGTQIYIPSIRDATTVGANGFIRDDAGDDVANSGVSNYETKLQNGKVNINTANIEKLQTLPGIGLSTAQKIVEYRMQNGKFKTEEDLKNVTGIGESKYNNLKDKITVK